MKNLFSHLTIIPLFIGITTNVISAVLPKNIQILIGLIAGVIFIIFILSRLYFVFNKKIIRRRFANLIYVLDAELNLALIKNSFYKKWQPPGKRLGFTESPHEAVFSVLQNVLGIAQSQYTFYPKGRFPNTYNETEIVPHPYQVQVERNPRGHKLGIAEHYDFVYVCLLNNGAIKSNLHSKNNKWEPKWFDLDYVKSLRDTNQEYGTWLDVVETYSTIIEELSSKS